MPQLDIPPLPLGCELLWLTFQQLHQSRGSAGMGPAPISQQDLQAWQHNNGVQLTPWEADTLMALDAVALKSLSETPANDKSAP